MSQNRPDGETNSTTGTGGTGTTGSTGTGGAGTGATDLGTTRDTAEGSLGTGGAGTSGAFGATGSTGATGGGTGGGLSTTGGGGAATGTARGLADQAKEYGQKVAGAASTAREFLTDKAGVVGDKLQDLRNRDYQEMAENAKQYARQNPGQALLVAAAAGFVIGLLLRGGRR
jgi:ElaB/YqjD/DUF883 family membrane-anchored ribosome-binding protein